jgi:Family of unknown function (DUF6065)
MRLVAHENGLPLKMIAGKNSRDWMDNSNGRSAYRCIPLSFANGSGWELLSPSSFAATWNGGRELRDIEIEDLDGYKPIYDIVQSHFGNGVLTIHPSYLFRTEPGWGIIARGPPNRPKDGIHALEGLIETDWLPFTFTMNWIFTRPGRVVFEKDEPLCFVTPFPQLLLEQITPEITRLENNPEMKAEFDAWATMRTAYNDDVKKGGIDVRKKYPTGHYVKGKTLTGSEALETHRTKRKLKQPVRVEKAEPLVATPLPMLMQAPTVTPEIAEAMKGCPMHALTQKMFDGVEGEKLKL